MSSRLILTQMVKLIVLAAFMTLTACSGMNGNSAVVQDQQLSIADYQALEESVENTFSNRCVGCHSSLVEDSNEPYLNLIYEMKVAQTFVIRGDPASSPLYRAIVNKRMPEGGPDLTTVAPAEVAAIYEWILFMPK